MDANGLLVFQSDFGLTDGAVCTMHGVALGVSDRLKVEDLTHDITPYDIWSASYGLFQTVSYWPAGTVFVSVVDPGVGSARKSVAARTKSGQYIVTPDNGTLTHIKLYVGVDAVREIDESVNRRAGTALSYTFHGRDVYAYTGARLASGAIDFEHVGGALPVADILELPTGEVTFSDGWVSGCVDIHDGRYGSLWTNILHEDFAKTGAQYGDRVRVEIQNGGALVYSNTVTYGHSFADVNIGEPIVYLNSLYRIAVAINQGSFAKAYSVGHGTHWQVRLRKA
ncbi:MAG: S-adenosyl-l-methionine hydroxide adenosyltransferase family protein [Oscillospiraceae bacterium]|nr:S-adenosyl-l-methionine hydroxide adenosyltransferase family protein [Oscillospiraceae bacterium]